MIVTYSYRLRPTRAQHRALETILESQRELYNAALEERIDAYRKAELTRTLFDQYRAVSEWRRLDPDATAVPVALQRWTLKILDTACCDFFRRLKDGAKTTFPRFRGRRQFATFGFRQICGIRYSNQRIRFKGMPGALRVHLHRPLPNAPLRSCTFTRDVKGWKVGFAMKVSDARPRRHGQAVGVDLGISIFCALSDGGSIPRLSLSAGAERSIRIAHRAFTRTDRNSRGNEKARVNLARCHAEVARARSNHLHQASARLVRDYSIIVVEKLNVAGLARGTLGKAIYDASWSRFVSMLQYKAECSGSRVIKVEPHNTSQECSRCGSLVTKSLKERIHSCPDCGLVIERDLNAARTILRRAGVSPGLLNVADQASVQAESSVVAESEQFGGRLSHYP